MRCVQLISIFNSFLIRQQSDTVLPVRFDVLSSRSPSFMKKSLEELSNRIHNEGVFSASNAAAIFTRLIFPTQCLQTNLFQITRLYSQEVHIAQRHFSLVGKLEVHSLAGKSGVIVCVGLHYFRCSFEREIEGYFCRCDISFVLENHQSQSRKCHPDPDGISPRNSAPRDNTNIQTHDHDVEIMNTVFSDYGKTFSTFPDLRYDYLVFI